MVQNGTLMMQNKRLVGIMVGAALLLMVPAVAMLFTGEMNWGVEDFVVAGILLFGTGAIFEFLARRGGSMAYKAGAGVALFGAFALIWVNLAVGFIGSEDNPANLLYLAVLVTLVFGAGLAKFRPMGMAKALFATAAVHFLVPVVAFLIFQPPFGPGVVAVFMLNSVFALVFAGAGFLFKIAAEKEVQGVAVGQ